MDATNHLILTLDPLEVFGAAESVQVTTHTVSATSLTVIRGQESSVARQHPLGTTWFHGPVASDYQGQRAHYLAAFRTAAYTITGTATVPYDTISQSDTGISFSTVTGIYTVQVDGTYYANGKLELNAVSGGRLILTVIMGGTSIRGSDHAGSTPGFDTYFATGIRRLVRGDTIRIDHNFVSGGPGSAAVGSLDVSHFFVYRLGD